MAPKNSMNSVIGVGSVFEGKFYVAGSLQVDGKFEGEVRTEASVIIGEKGKVKTNIFAKDVRVEGTMIGNIHAQNAVYLESNGRVLGDITAPSVHVSPGVVAKGSIHITGDGKKKANISIEEAYGSDEENASKKSNQLAFSASKTKIVGEVVQKKHKEKA